MRHHRPIGARRRTKTRIAGFLCVPQARPDMWRCAWRAACFTCYCLFWLSHRRAKTLSHMRVFLSTSARRVSNQPSVFFFCIRASRPLQLGVLCLSRPPVFSCILFLTFRLLLSFRCRRNRIPAARLCSFALRSRYAETRYSQKVPHYTHC